MAELKADEAKLTESIEMLKKEEVVSGPSGSQLEILQKKELDLAKVTAHTEFCLVIHVHFCSENMTFC